MSSAFLTARWDSLSNRHRSAYLAAGSSVSVFAGSRLAGRA